MSSALETEWTSDIDSVYGAGCCQKLVNNGSCSAFCELISAELACEDNKEEEGGISEARVGSKSEMDGRLSRSGIVLMLSQ